MIRISTLAVALCAAAIAVPAAAEIRVVTFRGTLSLSTNDNDGVFGPPHTYLGGTPYVARYIFDTTLGQRALTPGQSDRVYGGDYFGTMTPMLDASLTINGVTFHFGSQSDYGSAAIGNGVMIFDAKDYAITSNSITDIEVRSVSYPINNIPSLDVNVAPQSQLGYGYFQIRRVNALGNYTINTAGYLTEGVPPSYATVSISGSVPEPAAWTMLIVGFGLAGAVARRQRTQWSA